MNVVPLLGVVFVVLKLCNVIHWPWWWITAPFWIPLALMAVGFGLQGLAWLSMSPLQRSLARLQRSLEKRS